MSYDKTDITIVRKHGKVKAFTEDKKLVIEFSVKSARNSLRNVKPATLKELSKTAFDTINFGYVSGNGRDIQGGYHITKLEEREGGLKSFDRLAFIPESRGYDHAQSRLVTLRTNYLLAKLQV